MPLVREQQIWINLYKSSLPDGRIGKLRIRLTPDKDKMTLIVGDDGVGMPVSFAFETSQSLGLQLVNMLTKHDLQGHITLERKKGTLFCIEFPV